MNCSCHDEPAYWQADKRTKDGGYWYCAVTTRERQRQRYADANSRAKKLAQMRARYDTDYIFRIGKRLHDDARRRGERLKLRREALHGEISPEG